MGLVESMFSEGIRAQPPHWRTTHALLHPDTADDAQSGKKWLLEALWRKPNLLKKFRRILEETLEERLESMGISRVSLCIHCQHLQCQCSTEQLKDCSEQI